MTDWVGTAESLITSPWLYPLLLAASFLDSFLPVVPSEPVIIVAGARAAGGDTQLFLVIAATALGAFLGDLVPYGLGRLLSRPLLAGLRPDTRRRAAFDWIAGRLAARGGQVLMTSRFIPVGRYFVTLSAGAVGYPVGRFVLFTALAAAAWSTYTALTGYAGGLLFRDDPLTGTLVGLGLALVLQGVLVALRRVRRRPFSVRRRASPRRARPRLPCWGRRRP
ncbi:DedA family protein [Streptomyces silvensis]|uniref:VTT domain-containing protein n=1 Tax=Streptomyces silvensis TaxID=1765722 RepID=A0A0W7X7T8_9ACTN|nr:DedA family protein [Streptomyces silvensis]KUF19020.1 hypothetical protein AT728_08450 [Streptomyces silvensis]